MTGIYTTKLKNGIIKPIHLRNVSSITLNKTVVTFHYNFPCVTGRYYYESVKSEPAFDSFFWFSEEEASLEFEKCVKAFEELK